MGELGDLEPAMTEVSAAQHPPKSEWVWAELGVLREQWSIVRHPFYERWASGELTRHQRQLYAEEYDHLVVALAAVARNAAGKADGLLREVLRPHVATLEASVGLWRDFATGTGWGSSAAWHYGDDPYPATTACAQDWVGSGSRPLAQDLVTLFAIGGCLPEIARLVLDDTAHYGLEHGPATHFFRLHAELGDDQAELVQAALAGLLAAEDPFALIDRAEAAHRAHWNMLDGLQAGSWA
jgi:pyrroloquinoline quinone (PQQ) biosynthesis protein C